jgi:hypothetical protein
MVVEESVAEIGIRHGWHWSLSQGPLQRAGRAAGLGGQGGEVMQCVCVH